jgi:tetratricopeptide (TPR) repeat protein
MRVLAVSLGAALLFTTPPSFADADDLEALGRAIDEHPDDAKSYDAYAISAIREKRFDEAIRRLKIGVARIADYSEGYYKLAYAYRQKREWAEAADYYRRYLTLQPSKADPYFGLGAALEGLGDQRGAIAAYEKYVTLEKAPEKQRFIDQARAELTKLQRSAPDRPSPTAPPLSLKAQAEGLRKEGKLEEARLLYEKAIATETKSLDVYNDLGSVYFALKRYDEAVRLFRDATTKQPDFALGWYNLAHALRKSERPKEAADAYRQYAKIRPEDPDPYYGLGQSLKALGDVKGAVETFRKYIEMEKRPAEQRWVDKARAELQGLEAVQKSGS